MKKTGKFTNMWTLNNMLESNQRISEEIKRGIKTTLRHMKIEHAKTYEMQQKQF